MGMLINPFAVAPAGPSYTWYNRNSGAQDFRDIASTPDGQILLASVWGGYLHKSTDGGETWVTLTAAGIRDWVPVAVSANGLIMYAGAWKGAIWRSLDGGTTWASIRAGTSTTYWNSLSCSDDGVKLGAVMRGSATAAYVYTSSNSGTTWNGNKGGLAAHQVIKLNSTASIATTIVRGAANPIRQSSDLFLSYTGYGGAAGDWWAFDRSETGQFVVRAHVSLNLYVSNDGGTNWTKILDPGVKNWRACKMSRDGKYMYAAATGGGVYASSDFGVTWKLLSEPGTAAWNTIGISGDGKKVHFGAGGSTIRSLIVT